MVRINPMEIAGSWTVGYVLDYHIVSSTYIGDDEFGHPQFETQRTEIGELLYKFKYRSDNSVLGDLAAAVTTFVNRLNVSLSLVIPVPPSSIRNRQPIIILAEAISEQLAIPLATDAVEKIKHTPQMKDIPEHSERQSILKDAFRVNRDVVSGQSVLLFDDLFDSGATMNTIAENLFRVGHADKVYALAITRTGSR